MEDPLDQAHTSVLASQGYKGLHEFAATLTERVRELDAKERNFEIGSRQATQILTSIIESYVHAAVNVNVRYEIARKEGRPDFSGDTSVLDQVQKPLDRVGLDRMIEDMKEERL